MDFRLQLVVVGTMMPVILLGNSYIVNAILVNLFYFNGVYMRQKIGYLSAIFLVSFWDFVRNFSVGPYLLAYTILLILVYFLKRAILVSSDLRKVTLYLLINGIFLAARYFVGPQVPSECLIFQLVFNVALAVYPNFYFNGVRKIS